MNILDTILSAKRQEVADRKTRIPAAQLEKSHYLPITPSSMRYSLLQSFTNGIIAEFKRRSPSRGDINVHADVKSTTRSYAAGGASGISVLTDAHFFGGSWEDLDAAIQWGIPVLCKDFIIDEYQLLEARAHGASVILLIASCLSPEQVKQLSVAARAMDLEVLLEMHDASELDHFHPSVNIVGINNRNLKNFEVNLQQSMDLIAQLPEDVPAIAESGIQSIEAILQLEKVGFKGFLMGEHFMKQPDPGAAFLAFSAELKRIRPSFT